MRRINLTQVMTQSEMRKARADIFKPKRKLGLIHYVLTLQLDFPILCPDYSDTAHKIGLEYIKNGNLG